MTDDERDDLDEPRETPGLEPRDFVAAWTEADWAQAAHGYLVNAANDTDRSLVQGFLHWLLDEFDEGDDGDCAPVLSEGAFIEFLREGDAPLLPANEAGERLKQYCLDTRPEWFEEMYKVWLEREKDDDGNEDAEREYNTSRGV